MQACLAPFQTQMRAWICKQINCPPRRHIVSQSSSNLQKYKSAKTSQSRFSLIYQYYQARSCSGAFMIVNLFPTPFSICMYVARCDAPHVHVPDKHATRKTIREDQPEETSSLPHFIRHSGRGRSVSGGEGGGGRKGELIIFESFSEQDNCLLLRDYKIGSSFVRGRGGDICQFKLSILSSHAFLCGKQNLLEPK